MRYDDDRGGDSSTLCVSVSTGALSDTPGRGAAKDDTLCRLPPDDRGRRESITDAGRVSGEKAPCRTGFCGKVGFFEKSSVCVKSCPVRYAARKTIKYYPLSPYADHLPFGPAIPFGCTCGDILRLRGAPYASSTEGMTQRRPRPCLGRLSA